MDAFEKWLAQRKEGDMDFIYFYFKNYVFKKGEKL